MRPCESQRERLLDLLYGLIEDRGSEAALHEHLAGCEGCASELRSLRALLGAIRVDEAFPRQDDVDWGAFARETVGRALGEKRGGWRDWVTALSRPVTVSFRPAWAAAAVLVIAAGLALIGYGFRSGGDGQDGRVAPTAFVMLPEESLNQLTVNLARKNTAQYLRETRAVLVTLLDVEIGCEEEDSVDITAERAKALELLRRQRLVATELNRVPLLRAREVTDDLQALLLEISSFADCTRTDQIQTLRDVVESRRILVRMELLTQELERRRWGADV